jgi:hypothetical protein
MKMLVVSAMEALRMRKYTGLVPGFVCSLFLFAGLAAAEESGPAQQSSASEIVEKCPQAAILESQIKAKRNDIKAVEDTIKALRNRQKGEKEAELIKNQGEKQASLEALKQKDPEQYHNEMAQQFERQKKREQFRKQKAEELGAKPKMTHAQWIETIKTKNPQMYDLAIKKDALQAEIKALRVQMQDERKACMSKK